MQAGGQSEIIECKPYIYMVHLCEGAVQVFLLREFVVGHQGRQIGLIHLKCILKEVIAILDRNVETIGPYLCPHIYSYGVYLVHKKLGIHTSERTNNNNNNTPTHYIYIQNLSPGEFPKIQKKCAYTTALLASLLPMTVLSSISIYSFILRET